MSIKIITKSGEVIEADENFETIQRAMMNGTLIELKVGNNRKMINPTSIESIEAPKVETNGLYKQNAKASNFPFAMTPEETAAAQLKLQPLKAMFDAKKEAMLEMKAKEDATINTSYAAKYAGYQPSGEIIVPEVEEVIELPLIVKPKGRPKNAPKSSPEAV